MKGGHVYIMGSHSHVLYVGVTAHLIRRVHQHRSGSVDGFTGRYDVGKLLWCEAYDHILDAIAREKPIKRWRREKKVALIERTNPEFRDLWPTVNH